MPYLVVLIIGAFGKLLEHVVWRVLLALGVGFVTYQGIDTGLTYLVNLIHAQAGGLPDVVIRVLWATKVDKAISMITSATLAVYSMQAAAGAFTKMKIKGPTP